VSRGESLGIALPRSFLFAEKKMLSAMVLGLPDVGGVSNVDIDGK